ncbi:hypothetical protein HJFPF1_01245 [Paramyrothecium foliicola]|nr:hypothetical protein HJFPF1_01245 [Paramyrothecium foliicola]
MVGAPLYPDKEIEWLLDLIISGENSTSIRTKFEEVFGRPLRKNQIRYIKNKYGKDPRFKYAIIRPSVSSSFSSSSAALAAPSISPLINRRPKKNVRARTPRNGVVRRNYREDSDDDVEPASTRVKRIRREDDQDRAPRLTKTITQMEPDSLGDEKDSSKDKTKTDLTSKPTPSSVAYQQNPNQSGTMMIDPALQAPAMTPMMPSWQEGIGPNNYQANIANALSPPLAGMNNTYANPTGYEQTPNWATDLGLWGINGLPPCSPLQQGFDMLGSTGQLLQPPGGSRLHETMTDSNSFLSSYPLPTAQSTPMPYSDSGQSSFQGFPSMMPVHQNAGFGIPLPQAHPRTQNYMLGNNMPVHNNPLLHPQQMNLIVPPELATPTLQQQTQSLPSLESVIGTLSQPPAPQAAQQQSGSVPTQETSSLAWDESQWTSELPANPALGANWDKALTPLLYAPLGSEKSSQPSPELIQDDCLGPSTACFSGNPLLPSLPPPRTHSSPPPTPCAVPIIASSPNVAPKVWTELYMNMSGQIFDDPSEGREQNLKGEVSLFIPSDHSSGAIEGQQRGQVSFDIDTRLLDALSRKRSPVPKYGESAPNSPGGETTEIKNETYLWDDDWATLN